ncbi:MAG: hypothetical protein M0Z41_18585 [Peptococcaceae bacterium]|nr:hypothetical protein [Peptococcaceae bacterium]
MCVYRLEDGDISENTSYKDHETAASGYFIGLEVSLDMIFP